jgi:hypothetical protein
MQVDVFGAIGFKCPACGALPGNPCKGIGGLPMPSSHSKRKELVFTLTSPKCVLLEYPPRRTH